MINKLIVIVLVSILIYMLLLILNPKGSSNNISLDPYTIPEFSYEDATKVAESLR